MAFARPQALGAAAWGNQGAPATVGLGPAGTFTVAGTTAARAPPPYRRVERPADSATARIRRMSS
jgi:hypothetical protein